MGVKQSGWVFHPLHVLLLEKTGRKTHTCKDDEQKCNEFKEKGILGKAYAEEERRKALGNAHKQLISIGSTYYLPAWPTLETQHTAGGASVHDPYCLQVL